MTTVQARERQAATAQRAWVRRDALFVHFKAACSCQHNRFCHDRSGAGPCMGYLTVYDDPTIAGTGPVRCGCDSFQEET